MVGEWEEENGEGRRKHGRCGEEEGGRRDEVSCTGHLYFGALQTSSYLDPKAKVPEAPQARHLR